MTDKKASVTGPIIGGVIAGVSALTALLLGFFLLRKHLNAKSATQSNVEMPSTNASTITPIDIKRARKETVLPEQKNLAQLGLTGRAGSDATPSRFHKLQSLVSTTANVEPPSCHSVTSRTISNVPTSVTSPRELTLFSASESDSTVRDCILDPLLDF